jgi:putative cardiolipin synthase
MAEAVAEAEREVIVVTPYLIPGKEGIDFWKSVTEKKVRVLMLTNSLASNNHVVVHGGYSSYRKPLIRAGVELHELRVDASEVPEGEDEAAFESITLHTKMIMIDRRFLFVGSLNLDPRSIDINTEMGVLIDSADMASRIAEEFMIKVPKKSYRVVEDEKGSLRWYGMVDGEMVVEDSEPQAGRWRRFKAYISKILPESQL